MSGARPGLARAIAPVGLAGAALSAIVTVYSVDVYLPSLNTPHTPLEQVTRAPSAAPLGPGLARRLAVVFVDGLSFDAAKGLAELLPLRRAGVFRSLAVDFPSFTSPSLVSLMTGVPPRDSGTRRNGDRNGVKGLDTALAEADAAGVRVTVFARGDRDFAAVVAPPEHATVRVGPAAFAVDASRRLFDGADLPSFDGKSPARAFDLVAFSDVDEAGHLHGGASAEYRDEAAEAARFVARYAATLDLREDALVVVSDHGHLPEGGHGGDEREVRRAVFLGVGAIFRRGVELGERPMRDVASTLAVLAGVRAPSSSLGLPMLDALDLGDRETSYLMANPFDESAGLLCRLRPDPACDGVAPLVARLEAPEGAAWEEAAALHATLFAARERAIDAQRPRAGRVRLAIASGLALIATGLGLLRLRRRARSDASIRPLAELARSLLCAAALAGVYVACLTAKGYRPTFSHLMPIPIFAADATPSGLAAVVAAALCARLVRPGAAAPWVVLAAITTPFALLAAWVGYDAATVPPNVAGVLVFLLGPLIPTAAVGALVLAGMTRAR